LIYCAAVYKIEEKRKPEDFIGHRKRGGQISRSEISPCKQHMNASGLKSLDFSPLFLFAL
jgi:hypothetical protein